ncbi:MAG: hypothetical protein OCD02_19695 [Spirochaetaceae bacterium]
MFVINYMKALTFVVIIVIYNFLNFGKGTKMDRQWIIEQNNFETISEIKKFESLFTLGNGFLGLRGDLTIQNRAVDRGTYINGFYEKGKIKYGEKAYGFAENWQTMIPVPDSKEIKIEVDGIQLFNINGVFINNKRYLNMKNSSLKWEFEWQDNFSKQIYSGELITIVPFSTIGTVIHKLDINIPRPNSKVSIVSSIVLEMQTDLDEEDPRVSAHFNGTSLDITRDENYLLVHATGSDLLAGCKMGHDIKGLEINETQSSVVKNGLEKSWSGTAGDSIQITKVASYSYGELCDKKRILEDLEAELDKTLSDGFTKVLKKQENYMDLFWSRSNIVLSGDTDAETSLRYNIFQLLQSAGQDGKRSIAAKGLSGLGYEGHYFWDAEAYVLPFFVYTNPKIAKSMLLYRVSILGKAKDRANLLGHQGILFPWRTINGEESSAYFPAGTAQYHINADIALGLNLYLEVTGDYSIISEGGDGLLTGTADFWCSLADFIDEKGYCFNSVTGPDEYTAMVDNNLFTNLMAKKNLLSSAKWLKDIVSKEKVSKWLEVANNIYIPKARPVSPQDDSFLDKEKWDFKNTPADKYPLLLNFHPLNIYRKQVLKQADVVMAQSIFRDQFSPGLLKRNFDYYEELTTRDSSLSACAQGINAFWLGYEDLSWEYFLETIHTDRKNLHHNVSHGLHTASMGGSYLMIIRGFLGVETFKDTIRFRPKLPKKLTSIKLNIIVKNCSLTIEIKDDVISYLSVDKNIDIYHFGEKVELTKGEIKVLKTLPEMKVIQNSEIKGSLLEREEKIWKIINDKNLLPEEVLFLAKDENERDYYIKMGYYSDLASSKNSRGEFIKQITKTSPFLGKRPKS